MAKRRLQARLEVETEAGALLGGARIRLLEAIDKFGSISKAAQRIPMSYKAAWDALDDLNNLADFPVDRPQHWRRGRRRNEADPLRSQTRRDVPGRRGRVSGRDGPFA